MRWSSVGAGEAVGRRVALKTGVGGTVPVPVGVKTGVGVTIGETAVGLFPDEVVTGPQPTVATEELPEGQSRTGEERVCDCQVTIASEVTISHELVPLLTCSYPPSPLRHRSTVLCQLI
jgi:hypothetical protein